MRATEQLDLFSQRYVPAARYAPGGDHQWVVSPDSLDDDHLLAAILASNIRDTIASVAEAGRRRLAAAVPVLETLCQRFTGFGADVLVPEQAAALNAIVMIGGPEAAQTLGRLIVKQVVQGPCLVQALGAAAGVKAKLPAGTVMELLTDDRPQIRADACRCIRAWADAVPLLRDLLDDLHPEVRKAAACALGRLGRTEVRALLVSYLREEPCVELIEAIAPIADEECVILLGRVARTVPYLFEPALDALYSIDHSLSRKVAAALRDRRIE